MNKRILNLGEGLSIPAEDFIESATAVLAKRGAGKSGGIKVIMEELLAHGLPFVAIDPVGLAWGILSSLDGKRPSGHEVLVIGGDHGQIPLQRDGGAVIANAIADQNISVILDLNGTSKNAYRRFVTDFLNALRPKNKISRLVILLEASRLIPQRIRPDQTECYDAVEEAVLVGRNNGLGVLIEGQRPAVINKDVLSQVDSVIAMNITHNLDKKALQDWFQEAVEGGKEDFDAFWAEIQRLPKQEAVIWSPAFLKAFKRFRFRDFNTFHPDRTHLRRMGLLKTSAATTDVSDLAERLKGDLAKVVEKAKASDPVELRRKVVDLEARLAKVQLRPAAVPATPVSEPKVVEVPALKLVEIRRLETAAKRIEKAVENARSVAATEMQHILALNGILQRLDAGSEKQAAQSMPRIRPAITASYRLTGVSNAPVQTVREVSFGSAGEVVSVNGSANGALPKGERAILTAVAQYPEGASKEQLSVLTGYKTSSRNAYVARLRERGYLGYSGDLVIATTEGIIALGSDFEPLPKGKALQDYWLRNLPEGEKRVLDVLLGTNGPIERAALDEKVGYKTSSRNAYLARLSARKLIVTNRDGTVQPSPVLFEGG